MPFGPRVHINKEEYQTYVAKRMGTGLPVYVLYVNFLKSG